FEGLEMKFEPAGPLRTSTNLVGHEAGTRSQTESENFATLVDLAAEVVAATGLVSPDRLTSAQGRAGTGSLAEALRDEGVVAADDVARSLGRRFQLPHIDLSEERVSPDA